MRLLLTVIFLTHASFGAAADLSLLKQDGVVALMRHALAPGTGDPAGFELGECSTQRNLDDRGRAQARRTGEALRDAGVTFDHVWTSQWCRSRDTARLMDMGEVVEKPPLNSFFGGQGDRARQTAETRALIAALPPDARLLIVTHQVNITALTGRAVRSGEIIVTRRTEDGLRPVGRISIDR
ncbi:histidine phosphatase family protein [Roseovarius sp. D22-M7]|uniref:histidine phosphatase family protein n=1 Tax=Roseovarius sp. D22-M7 TaxID=3127116 RepID=UPI00300FE034